MIRNIASHYDNAYNANNDVCYDLVLSYTRNGKQNHSVGI